MSVRSSDRHFVRPLALFSAFFTCQLSTVFEVVEFKDNIINNYKTTKQKLQQQQKKKNYDNNNNKNNNNNNNNNDDNGNNNDYDYYGIYFVMLRVDAAGTRAVRSSVTKKENGLTSELFLLATENAR